MKTKAAILWEIGAEWSVEEVELDPPKAGEVLVEMAASGLCHSDEHAVTGDLPMTMPVIGGHEGAGVVLEVGDGVDWLAPGDHVVFSGIPACGRCVPCSTGHSNLCDLGARILGGLQADGTSRHHARGQDVRTSCLLGTFSHHTVVNEASCVKIDPDYPLDRACLLGCGVMTGWGSAVNKAEVRAGETVAVLGAGGIGSNAIQGARLAGAKHIVAVDPVEFKREKALGFGATHTAASFEEATELLRQLTWGTMADKVIMTMSVGDGELLAGALAMAGKGGRVVVTNLHPIMETTANISLIDLTLMEKQVVGSCFGSGNARADVPRLLEMWRGGQLDLDGLITQRLPLEGVNEGYEAMRNGTAIRTVLVYD
jgi:S-(hydroxymethyl)glutathione dehydrogenase/alcohol dehydrogenase